MLQENVFEPAQLANMRYPHLLPSRSDVNAFHLVGRSSRGMFVHARARRLDAIGVKKIFKAAPTTPPVSLVGKISQLAPTANGEALLVLGETGRVQSWEMGQDEVITDMAIAEAEVPPNAKIATWHDGMCQISPPQILSTTDRHTCQDDSSLSPRGALCVYSSSATPNACSFSLRSKSISPWTTS